MCRTGKGCTLQNVARTRHLARQTWQLRVAAVSESMAVRLNPLLVFPGSRFLLGALKLPLCCAVIEVVQVRRDRLHCAYRWDVGDMPSTTATATILLNAAYDMAPTDLEQKMMESRSDGWEDTSWIF
jgi:hypothetical protein